MKIIDSWQMERYKFYKESKALDFIKDYFDVKDGVRCIAVHHPKGKENPDKIYRGYQYQNNKQRLVTFYPELLINYNCIHSYMYIFDRKVLDLVEQDDAIKLYRASAVGINAILEIDSPNESEDKRAKRLDIMDYIPELNDTISIIDKQLEDGDNYSGEDYNILFSGNGIYIILEGYYPRLDNEVENLLTYKDNFINLFENVLGELRDKTKVHIDNAEAPWNDYMKIPFTFHEKTPRISIPLPKGEEIIKEDLQYYSDADNAIKNPEIVEEIIKRAKWEKLW